MFLLFMLVLGGITIWLLEHNYANEFSFSRWEKVLEVMAAPEFRIEYLGLVYPHIPIYVLMPFYFIPGVDGSTAPYLVASLIGASLLALWNYHLARKGYSPGSRLVYCLAILAHPYFLWGVTTGTDHALSLVMFYMLYHACVRMILQQDARAFMYLGLVFALYFFVDERTFFLFLALLPLIPLIAPPRMLAESALSVYLIIAFPLLILISAWIYLNWIFYDDPWVFLYSTESSFRGAWLDTPSIGWLQQYGGNGISAAVIALLLAALAYPILLWLVRESRNHRVLLRGGLVMLLHPVIAVGIATYAYFLPHPSHILFLFSAATMAAMVLLPRKSAKKRLQIHVFLILSIIGGWWSFFWSPSPDMQRWSTAWHSRLENRNYVADQSLAQWLGKYNAETMLDDRSTYRVIVYLGHARDLVLPFSSRFKHALRQDNPDVAQVVVPAPGSNAAQRDAIAARYPDLYRHGLPGYELVYDQDCWRVYRLQTATIAMRE